MRQISQNALTKNKISLHLKTKLKSQEDLIASYQMILSSSKKINIYSKMIRSSVLMQSERWAGKNKNIIKDDGWEHKFIIRNLNLIIN